MGPPKPRRSASGKTARSKAQSPTVYENVLNTCFIRRWRVDLFYVPQTKKCGPRWCVEVRDGKELLVKEATGEAAPECFRVLGSKLKSSLEKSRLLDE